jgi:tetrahydromethanopterin S-methyltransferase subunit E
MLKRYHAAQRSRFEVTWTDIAVGCAAFCAVFYDSWRGLMESLPSIMQGVIITSTVVFVLFRAANEVRKYWKGHRDDS